MIDNQTVGKTIAALRQQANLSQQGLANLCSVTHQAVSKWENGMALPDMQTMLFLSKYFEVSMEDILMGNLPGPADIENVSMADAETCENIQTEAEDEEALFAAGGEEYEEAMSAANGKEYREAMAAAGKQEEEKNPSMDWKQIAHLAPFASRGTIEQLVREKVEKGDVASWEQVFHLLPFCSRSMADYLLDKLDTGALDWKYATRIMVHASRDRVDKIFEKFLDEMDVAKLTQIAPFVSRQFIAECLRSMDDVNLDQVTRRLLPFLPRDMVDELIMKKMGKVQTGQESDAKIENAPEKQERIQVRILRREARREDGRERSQSLEEKLEKAPEKKERTLMRIARKAVEEGNEEWLEEHGDELIQEELEVILPMAAKKQMWGALQELWEHADDATLQYLIHAAIEQKNWELLEELQEHANDANLGNIAKAAMTAKQWELLEELQEYLDDSSLAAAAKAASDARQWDLVEEMLDRLDQDTLQTVLDAAMADSNWDMIDEIKEYLDEE